jgi:hypothetical protein
VRSINMKFGQFYSEVLSLAVLLGYSQSQVAKFESEIYICFEEGMSAEHCVTEVF